MTGSAATTRADAVRRRRKQETGKRLSESAVRATRPAPPITSRANATVLPGSRSRRPAKRRSEAAISVPGIEVRMPAISFTGPGAKWRFVSFLLAILVGGALYGASSSPALLAAPAHALGNQRISTEEINAAIGAAGKPIFTLIPGEIEKRLRLSFPDLLGAQVKIGLPDQVYVEVIEREPVIAWHEDGGYTWIDAGGVAFRPRGSADRLVDVVARNRPSPPSAESADPLAPVPFIPQDLVSAVRALAAHVPQGEEMIYDARYGLGWLDPRGWEVFFGEGSTDLELKLRVYESVEQLARSKGIRPAFISVQYPSAPYYRMSQ